MAPERRGAVRRARTARGTVGLAFRRVWRRLWTHQSRRTALAVAGVALAVGVTVVVAGVATGLQGSATVEAEGVDYWIVPEGGGTESLALTTEGPRLGSVHDVAAELRTEEGVEYATPVAIEPLRVGTTGSDESTYVLAVGVVPPEDDRSVAGIDVSALPSGSSSGDGQRSWQGAAILTPATADDLGVSEGATLGTGGSDRRIEVVGTSERDLGAGVGQVPGVVLPLSDLQALTGLDEGDRADQIVVATSDPSVRDDLTGVYPRTKVVERGSIVGTGGQGSDVPAALTVAATVVAGGLGVLFVATTMGLELSAARRELAVLDAVGVSGATRALLVGVETVALTAFGGLLGVAVGWGGVALLNRGVDWYLGRPGVAELTPRVAGYGLALALVVGFLATPYPVVRAARTDPREVLP